MKSADPIITNSSTQRLSLLTSSDLTAPEKTATSIPTLSIVIKTICVASITYAPYLTLQLIFRRLLVDVGSGGRDLHPTLRHVLCLSIVISYLHYLICLRRYCGIRTRAPLSHSGFMAPYGASSDRGTSYPDTVGDGTGIEPVRPCWGACRPHMILFPLH